MSNGIKVYKNPQRGHVEERVPKVPLYQDLGVEPTPVNMGPVPMNYPSAAFNSDNPRTRNIGHPYVNTVPSQNVQNSGPMPNVGNNVEQTWSSVDGEIIDDFVAPNYNVTNNNFVSEEDYNEAVAKVNSLHAYMTEQQPVQNQSDDQPDLFYILQDLEENSCLLIAGGVAVCSGPLEEIQEQANALIFGEHELCGGTPIPIKDILILKKPVLKFGLFVE